MNEVAGVHVVDSQRMPGFLQELFIAYKVGLLTFTVRTQNLNSQDTNYYLQQVEDLALTVAGQDRARGRVVVQQPPDPDEDDDRPISSLILKQVAAAITEQVRT